MLCFGLRMGGSGGWKRSLCLCLQQAGTKKRIGCKDLAGGGGRPKGGEAEGGGLMG